MTAMKTAGFPTEGVGSPLRWAQAKEKEHEKKKEKEEEEEERRRNRRLELSGCYLLGGAQVACMIDIGYDSHSCARNYRMHP